MSPELYDFLIQFVTENKLRRFEEALDLRTRFLTIVLEDVYQPHNASACLRSADCFGLQDVHIVENENRFAPSVDIARGAGHWLTLHRYTHQSQTKQCLSSLREQGYQIVATSPNELGCPLNEFELDRPTAVVFGRECNGVSPEVDEAADADLRIPMYGFTESFNVSVSVALVLQHLRWQLNDLDADWHLSDAERTELKQQWVRRVSE